MQENFSFRTSFKGFNREDVINYINKILEESSDNISRIASLESEIAGLNVQLSDLKLSNERLTAENRNLIEEKEYEQKRAESYADKSLEEKYEARLGSALMDAKRFSDLLIQEANDKCSTLFSSASEAADKSSVVAKAISEELQKVSVSVSSTLSILTKNMRLISDSLKNFSNEAESKKEQFDFHSDFKTEPEIAAPSTTETPEVVETMLSDILKLSEEFDG